MIFSAIKSLFTIKMELYYDIKYVNHDFRMVHSMADMITNKQLTDCSLVAEGKTLRAHRVVLAAASEYLLVSSH